MTAEPDYARYSLEDLREAWTTIDAKRWPDRARTLERLIAAQLARQPQVDEEPAAERPINHQVALVIAELTVLVGGSFSIWPRLPQLHGYAGLKVLLMVMAIVTVVHALYQTLRIFKRLENADETDPER